MNRWPPGMMHPFGPWDNPAVPGPGQPTTIPSPQPADTPPASWFGPVANVLWQPSGAPPGGNDPAWVAAWESPIFDLRPEFRGSIYSPYGDVNGSQPIWKAGAGQLFVAVLLPPAPTISLTGTMNVRSVEYASIADPRRLQTITSPEDLADYFQPGKRVALMSFTAPGNGQAVRFWKCQLNFELYTNNLPMLEIEGAYY
jgi:hypothetical protein